MSTRMQQRRGTSSQWTAANSVLASGEIGFETNTGKFKIGNGTSAWADLVYYASSDDVAAIIDGAPTALNTLKELAAAIDNNASFASTIVQSLSEKASTTSVSTSFTNERSYTNSAITSAIDSEVSSRNSAISSAVSTAVAPLATLASPALTGTPTAPTASAAVANTQIATTAYAKAAADTAQSAAITAAASDATSKVATESTNRTTAISTHNSATTNVHGITDTSALATKTYADGKASDAQTAATTAAATAADTKVSTHNSATTNVHGIADTSALALTATVNSGLALKANLASPTFTGTVSGITSTMVGLGNVDNTSDANKPVSTATTTALALKAPLASPALTGVPTAPTATAGTSTTQVATTAFVGTAVSNLVNSAPAALDTLNELATALGNDASFSTTITNALALKAPLASPTFTGTNTVAALTVSGSGLITASSAGIAFTDGTQTKEGVISRTPIVQKTASYTLSALTERDSLVEISSASGVTLTVPTNATVAYPVGTSIDILQTGAGQITVAAASGVTVNATPGLKLRTQWSGATLFKRATDTWVLYGDLSA